MVTSSTPGEDATAVQSKKEGRLLQRQRQRLVLVALPYQGHLNPMIQLANLLDSKGFTIIFILTNSTPLDHSKYPNLQFRQIPDGLPETKSGSGAAKDVTGILTQLNINLIEPLRECLVDLLTEEESVGCLISDVNWYFTQQVADDLKLPRIAFRTSSVSSFLALDYLPVFHQKGYLSGQDYKPEDEVEEFPPLKVKDIPMVPKTDPEVFWNYIEKMLSSCKKSSGLIFNTFKELEGKQLSNISDSLGIKTFAIGPLHKYFSASSSSLLKQDVSAVSWLDTQAPKSVIYVSFGSIAEMEKTDLIELAWGLINSDQPFLLVIRHNNSNWLQHLPDAFLETVDRRGYIVNWAPQQQVLAHPAVGLFWTHSGWNSITESLCEGVPMICSPFFADQMVNSRFVNDVWKVGLSLEKGFDRLEIEGAIRKLMAEKESQVRSRVVALKEQIDCSVQDGGSSCQSLQSFIDYICSFSMNSD